MHYDSLDDEDRRSSPGGYSIVHIILVLLVFGMGLSGSVMLFVTFHDQSATYSGLPASYNEGAAITFIVSAISLAPILNVLSFFTKNFTLVVVSAGLTAYLAPNFIVQLAYFASCQQGGVAMPGKVCEEVDVPVALGGYCLLMCAVYFSFLVCPGHLRRFPTGMNKIMLFLSLLVGAISLTASILFSVAGANEISDSKSWLGSNDNDPASLIYTAVMNFQASLFFFASIFVRSVPLTHSALFYLGSYYGLPLLPSLTGTADLGETKAGSALGYIGIVIMILFLLHRSYFPAHHHGDVDEEKEKDVQVEYT